MKPIKLKLKKENTICFFLLFFPVIIDCINGYQKGSTGDGESLIGILYRGTIVGVSCLYLFRNIFSKYILIIFIAVYISLTYQIIAGYFSLSEISSLIKVLYVFSVLSILLGSKHFSNIYCVTNCAIGYGVVASLVLIYSFIFKIGYSSYVEGTFGTKGFFIAMNDVGLTILLLNILSCFFYLKTNKIKYLTTSVIMTIGALLVGSMACNLGTAVILLNISFCILFIKFKDFKSSKKQKIVTILGAFFFLYTVVWLIIDTIINDPYLSGKYSDILETISEMSGRKFFISAAVETLNEYSLFDWLFGTGVQYDISIQNVLGWSAPKSAEVDPLDLIGKYGVIFSVLLICFSLLFFCKTAKSFFINRDLLSYWLSIGFILYLLHSVYGGHAFTSPLVSSYLAIFIYLYVKRKEISKI